MLEFINGKLYISPKPYNHLEKCLGVLLKGVRLGRDPGVLDFKKTQLKGRPRMGGKMGICFSENEDMCCGRELGGFFCETCVLHVEIQKYLEASRINGFV